MFDERSCVFIEIGSERDFSFQDVSINSHGVFIIEGIDSSMHFIDENSKSPPIDCFSVTLVENDFRCDILRGSTYCEGSSFCEEFRKTKISKFKISVVSDEKIFGFKVSEDDIL